MGLPGLTWAGDTRPMALGITDDGRVLWSDKVDLLRVA
jgi:hypothetical protein